jgi:4-hydroxy-2-oxoheptanedioate aldolase
MKDLKNRLRNGETLKGCWLSLGNALTAEIVGLSGYDWALIDMEHGPGTEADVLHQLQALEHTPAGAVVRVESFERQRIHRVLDLGAEGIMCPRINSAAEAEQVVSGLRYPPEGTRGVDKMVRATGFGKDLAEYREMAKDKLLCVVQVETIEVLDHLDDIAAVDGVDVLFVGPADLSMELGNFGDFEHPRFVDALEATIRATERAGKIAGILATRPEEFSRYQEMGMRMISCGSDAGFVVEGANSMARKLVTSPPTPSKVQ